MFYCYINESGVGIYNNRALIPMNFPEDTDFFQDTNFGEIEDYVRTKLSFDDLYDLGWEDGIDIRYMNHFHTKEDQRMFLSVRNRWR